MSEREKEILEKAYRKTSAHVRKRARLFGRHDQHRGGDERETERKIAEAGKIRRKGKSEWKR